MKITSKEAVNLLKQYNWLNEDEIADILEMLEELADRDTPKKPLVVEVSAENEHHYDCPTCNDNINIGDSIGYNKVFNVFCRECGQRLDWKRKPKIELSIDEIIILKNMDKKYKYIARDARNNKGSLKVYEKKPIKVNEYYRSFAPTNNVDWHRLYAFYHLFQDITFDSGVHVIDDLIKENVE